MSLARKKARPANRKEMTVDDLISHYESEVAELEQVYDELQKIKESVKPPTPKPPTPEPEPEPPKPPTPKPPTPEPVKVASPKKKIRVVQYKKKVVEPPPMVKPPPRTTETLSIDESLEMLKPKEKKKKWTVIYYEDSDKTKEIRREEYSTNKAAAEILGCSGSTITTWARKGKDLKKPFVIVKNE